MKIGVIWDVIRVDW